MTQRIWPFLAPAQWEFPALGFPILLTSYLLFFLILVKLLQHFHFRNIFSNPNLVLLLHQLHIKSAWRNSKNAYIYSMCFLLWFKQKTIIIYLFFSGCNCAGTSLTHPSKIKIKKAQEKGNKLIKVEPDVRGGSWFIWTSSSCGMLLSSSISCSIISLLVLELFILLSPQGRVRVLALVVKLFSISTSVALRVYSSNLLSLLETEISNSNDTLATLSSLELLYEVCS